MEALAPWFHNIDLGDGIVTAPDHFLGDYPRFKFARFADALPVDLAGKSVLDIGCNAGFYSVEMKRRGAGRVVGIDSDEPLFGTGAARLRGARLLPRGSSSATCQSTMLRTWASGSIS